MHRTLFTALEIFYQLLEVDQETCGIITIHICGWETANFVKLSSFSFTRRAQGHGHSRIEVCGVRFVHIFFIYNNLLMDRLYSHYINLPAYLKLMNIDITRILNVRDNNLIYYYTFHLRLVLDSKVLRMK